MGGNYQKSCSIHGVLFDYGRVDDRCVQFDGCHSFLSFLGSYADSDVPDNRSLGWFKPGLCGDKVFSVYVNRLSTDARGNYLFVFRI